VIKANEINPFLKSLSDRRFDVIYLNADIFGPIHLARHLINNLVTPGGMLAFISSHRGSVEINVEAGLELYRASKVSLNMLAHGIYADYRQ